MSLSKLERETIINFNEEEDTANVYTVSPIAKRQVEKAYGVTMQPCGETTDAGWQVDLPKSYFTFRKPRVLSDKAKKALAEASKKTRFSQN